MPSHKTILWVKRKVGRVYVGACAATAMVGAPCPAFFVSCQMHEFVAFDLVVNCAPTATETGGENGCAGRAGVKLTSGAARPNSGGAIQSRRRCKSWDGVVDGAASARVPSECDDELCRGDMFLLVI
jgi:hypothetical protein